MRLAFVSIFPKMIDQAMRFGVIGRALESGLFDLQVVDPREFTIDVHRSVDDKPFGGGPGMLMTAPIMETAIQSLGDSCSRRAVVFPDPAGELFRQSHAIELSQMEEVFFICGRYEGIDERFVQRHATHRFSIGDFVVSGGEIPSIAMADAILRNVPGVLGDSQSLVIDSFDHGLLGAPQFTRPEDWDDNPVPEVLVSGNHSEIAKWKRTQALRTTRERRPDLFAFANLEKGDADMLSS